MSVINESQAGDELICVEAFEGAPQGTRPAPATNRTFRVGERVRFVSFYRHQNLWDNPVCWMVVFDAADGKRYAATQTYFVTSECWKGLKRHFAVRRRKKPAAKKPKSAEQRQAVRKKPLFVSGSKKRRIA